MELEYKWPKKANLFAWIWKEKNNSAWWWWGLHSTLFSSFFSIFVFTTLIFTIHVITDKFKYSLRKTKSLREVYENSRNILNEDLVNFALFADVNPIVFEDASKEEKWKNATNQKIDTT